MRHDAHSGWVWDLAADSTGRASTVYSASWDNIVKAWDLETNLTCVQQFRYDQRSNLTPRHANVDKISIECYR